MKKLIIKIKNIFLNFLINIYYIVSNQNLEFKFFFIFREKNIEKKLKKLNLLYKNHKENPYVVYNYSFFHQHYGDYNLAFKAIKNFDKILYNWIKKKKLLELDKIRFLNSSHLYGSFGNCLTLFYYFFNKLNILKNKIKPYMLTYENQVFTNKYLAKFFLKHINLINSNQIKNNLKFIHNTNIIPVSFTIPFKNKYYPFFAGVNFQMNNLKKLNKTFYDFLSLPKKDISIGYRYLKAMGADIKNPFITLHVRENFNSEDVNIFNSEPLKYLKGIKEAISRGYTVIRVGDNSMSKLPKIDGLIDYPFSKYKSEFMDIFLAAECSFCAGTSSGFWTVPFIFNKPILLLNYLPILDYYLLNNNSLFLPKKLKNHMGKLLRYKELFTMKKAGYLLTKQQFLRKNILIEDNSEEEIQEAFKEMIDSINKGTKQNKFLKYNKNFKSKLNKLNQHTFDFPLKAKANFTSNFIKSIE